MKIEFLIMNLVLPNDCLAVFVDDTGHEALVKGHPVYGLGGCAVMAPHLDRIIRQPWREVRQLITGSANIPLHAYDFKRTATPEHIKTVAAFFRTQPFGRFGATISIKTKLTSEIKSVPTIAMVLKKRVADIAKWTTCKEIAVIFESSDRDNSKIQDAFQNFDLQENGKIIPVECYFMPKSAADPALEVADFVIYAIRRQVNRDLEQRDGFNPDFQAVFHSVDRRLTSFMAIETVSVTKTETM